jgi:hypothetical protein
MATKTYRLRQPHRLDHVDRPAGFVFRLEQVNGDWLVSQGKAEQVDAPPPAALLQPPPIAPPTVAKPAPRLSRCCGWNQRT